MNDFMEQVREEIRRDRKLRWLVRWEIMKLWIHEFYLRLKSHRDRIDSPVSFWQSSPMGLTDELRAQISTTGQPLAPDSRETKPNISVDTGRQR